MKLCVDQEEILKHMEENGIGTHLAIFYKAYCVVYIRKRKFSKANDWILLGKQRNAKPTTKMNEFVKEFEDNMKERLYRDFHSQNKKLSDDDVVEIPVLYSNDDDGVNNSTSNILARLDDDDNDEDDDETKPLSLAKKSKRKCPFDGILEQRVKKVRLQDLVSSVKMGEFNIYVDPECRSAIPKTTTLVNEYDALCHKYKFSLDSVPPEGKFLSWVSQQMVKSELSISLDMSTSTNQNSQSYIRV